MAAGEGDRAGWGADERGMVVGGPAGTGPRGNCVFVIVIGGIEGKGGGYCV